METTEKRFESDIESFLISPAGGYAKTAYTRNILLSMLHEKEGRLNASDN